MGIRPNWVEKIEYYDFEKRLENKSITEIIIAISATLDGQTTANYLAEILSRFNINITRLAHGLPVGGELDFLDDGTIAQALKARNKL